MGYDISYHPIKESEINEWYFDVLEGKTEITKLFAEYGIGDFHIENYRRVIDTGRATQPSDYFDKTHGFYIAVVQGFFRTYYYTRGSAFSFLIEQHPEFERYTKTWQNILGNKVTIPVFNTIRENYQSGVYIPSDKVTELLADYAENEATRDTLNKFFTHNIVVFLKALESAKTLGAGLLEATEVVEPNPFDLNKSTSYSNLHNCDTEGALLYSEFALAQIREIEEREKMQQGEILDNAAQTKVVAAHKGEESQASRKEGKEGKGFWKGLFGK